MDSFHSAALWLRLVLSLRIGRRIDDPFRVLFTAAKVPRCDWHGGHQYEQNNGFIPSELPAVQDREYHKPVNLPAYPDR